MKTAESAFATVYITRKCNNRCLHCYQSDFSLPADPERVKKSLKKIASLGIKRIEFSGGEPTCEKELPALTAFAKKAGFESIFLATNGKLMAYPSYSSLLVQLGIQSASIPFFSYNRPVFNRLANAADAFEMTVKGIENLRRNNNFHIHCVIPVTCLNYKDLPSTVSFLLKLGVNLIGMQFLIPFDIFNPLEPANRQLLKNIPAYTDARPYVKGALGMAAKGGVRCYIENAPQCQLEGMGSRVINELTGPDNYFIGPEGSIGKTAGLLQKGTFKTSACAECSFTDKCPGLFFSYQKKFAAHNDTALKHRHSYLSVDIQYGPCEYRCSFCARQEGGIPFHSIRETRPFTPGLEYLKNLLRRHAKRGFRNIHIYGRERADTLAATRRILLTAKKEKFKKVTLWSSGLRFSGKKHVKMLLKHGATDFKMPIYGYDDKTHDSITRSKGSFLRLKKSIETLNSIKAPFELHTILLRSNLSSFPDLCGVAEKKFGMSSLELLMYMPEGGLSRNEKDPYLANLVSFSAIFNQLKSFKSGLSLNCVLFPDCVAEKFRPHFRKVNIHGLDLTWVISLKQNRLDYKIVDERHGMTHTKICQGCVKKPTCKGIFKNYLDIFGHDGISAINRGT